MPSFAAGRTVSRHDRQRARAEIDAQVYTMNAGITAQVLDTAWFVYSYCKTAISSDSGQDATLLPRCGSRPGRRSAGTRVVNVLQSVSSHEY